MEGVLRTSAVLRRIGERPDDLVELDYRSRPAVGNDQRPRKRVRRADVKKVNWQPVDLGRELAEAVEHRLATPPVVAFEPIGADVLHQIQWRTLRGVVHRLALRPPRCGEAAAQVVELLFGDTQLERRDRTHAPTEVCSP